MGKFNINFVGFRWDSAIDNCTSCECRYGNITDATPLLLCHYFIVKWCKCCSSGEMGQGMVKMASTIRSTLTWFEIQFNMPLMINWCDIHEVDFSLITKRKAIVECRNSVHRAAFDLSTVARLASTPYDSDMNIKRCVAMTILITYYSHPQDDDNWWRSCNFVCWARAWKTPKKMYNRIHCAISISPFEPSIFGICGIWMAGTSAPIIIHGTIRICFYFRHISTGYKSCQAHI